MRPGLSLYQSQTIITGKENSKPTHVMNIEAKIKQQNSTEYLQTESNSIWKDTTS